MPITKSAKKSLKQSKKRRQRNLRRLKAMREIIKQIKKLVSENKKEEALKLLPKAYKTIDKTAKANIIKKNAAARKKSRLTKLVNKSLVPTKVGATGPRLAKGEEGPKASSETAPKQS